MAISFDKVIIPLKGKPIWQAIRSVFHIEVSKPWFTDFQHPQKHLLRTDSSKAIQNRRLKATSPSNVRDWIDRFNLLSNPHYSPAESRLMWTKPERTLKRRSIARLEHLAPAVSTRKIASSSNTKLRHCSLFISTDGTLLITGYVLRDTKEAQFSHVISEETFHAAVPFRHYAIFKSVFWHPDLVQDIADQFHQVWLMLNPGSHDPESKLSRWTIQIARSAVGRHWPSLCSPTRSSRYMMILSSTHNRCTFEATQRCLFLLIQTSTCQNSSRVGISLRNFP